MKKLDKHVGDVLISALYALQQFILLVAIVCFMINNTHACDISLMLFCVMICLEHFVEKLIDKE